MNTYRCSACNRWLFASDAEHGRLQITCPDRRCRRSQLVKLGERTERERDEHVKPVQQLTATYM